MAGGKSALVYNQDSAKQLRCISTWKNPLREKSIPIGNGMQAFVTASDKLA